MLGKFQKKLQRYLKSKVWIENQHKQTGAYFRKIKHPGIARLVKKCPFKKNYTHVKKEGETSKLALAFIDELEKQLFIKKTVEVDQYKM